MRTKLFDLNPETGEKVLWHTEEDGTFHVEHQQDVAKILEWTKAAYNAVDERARFGNSGMVHIAALPLSIYQQLMEDGTLRDPARFKKWLNDPDNKYFRVRPGRV